MSSLEQRLQAFVKLGAFLREYDLHGSVSDISGSGDYHDLHSALDLAGMKNGWFTKENLDHAVAAWGRQLTEEKLHGWMSGYAVPERQPMTVAIIMAGNIPMVGFHDLLSVLITGNKALVKLASGGAVLLPALVKQLIRLEPQLEGSVTFADGILKDYNAVIATGSDNTARYFEYYFGSKPHIIRKNRNSAAILSGEETPEQLQALGVDIFRYFGLGCRSVSKLFVPAGYKFDAFFEAIQPYESLKNHHKYHNNYDYNKAVYLMSEFPFLDNGFLILKEDQQYASPIGTVYYETYSSKEQLRNKIHADQERIQCIVGSGFSGKEVAFGQTQHPSLDDYADGVDTVEFLLKTPQN
jgi:hypothetical protein